MRQPTRHGSALLACALAGMAACSQEPVQSAAVQAVCDVGATRACVGANGCDGVQSCLPDGTAWSPCGCAVPVDAGRVEAGEASAPIDAPVDAPIDRVERDAAVVPVKDAASDEAEAGPPPTGCAPGEDPTVDLDKNGVADCKETLVHNSQFPSATTGWVAAPNVASDVTIERSTQDATGSPTPGSIKVTNTLYSTKTMVSTLGPGQCVPVVANTRYRVAAQFLIPSGQQNAGASVRLFFYSDGACQSFLTPIAPLMPAFTADAWTLFSAEILAPMGALSANVELHAEKNFPDPPTSVLYDDVLFRADP